MSQRRGEHNGDDAGVDQWNKGSKCDGVIREEREKKLIVQTIVVTMPLQAVLVMESMLRWLRWWCHSLTSAVAVWECARSWRAVTWPVAKKSSSICGMLTWVMQVESWTYVQASRMYRLDRKS